MTEPFIDTALTTLNALESRLERLEWYLGGSNEVQDTLRHLPDQGRDGAVQERLRRLEHELTQLSTKSPVVNNLLRLQATYPDLFQPSISDLPATLSTAELLSIISACATSYPTTASRLNAIKDLPIPPAESSALLTALQPRLANVDIMQKTQAQDIAELRGRSAAAIQRWYELRVLGESECWTEWEGRIVNVEKLVRREEMHQRQEAKENETYQT
ncbi:hypothetical protein ACLMJK_002986 [Lecanora helva]